MELILTRIAKKKGYTIGRLQTLSDSTDPSRPPLKGEERKSPFKGDLQGKDSSPLRGGWEGSLNRKISL